MKNLRLTRWLPWLFLAATLSIAAAIYAPGLAGSFVFDDATFIVANTGIQVTTARLGDWVAAATSFPGGSHQGRWLGMLSFAANHYFSGLDPYWLKLTNLGIHLLNGVLVFLMTRALFALLHTCRPVAVESRRFDGALAAAAIAGLWLVLPINLTSVLYISQRLESLSSTFVFLGLWLYLRARISLCKGTGGPAAIWVALLACTGVGTLVKESAIMLPLYAACVEFAIADWRGHDGRRSRPLVYLYAVTLGIPLIAGGVWLASWVGSASSYARPFDTAERLMTEARILVDYIGWILVPQPESLTLYHDDIGISRGLLTPPATLAAILALTAWLGFALWGKTRRPLFALGTLWFFAGHLLTGTIIPLMLAFEHRNYFPSVGLLLAGASILTLETGPQRRSVRAAICCCLFSFYAFSTWMRADEWSSPLRLAFSEANKHPTSSAAQYDLGRILLHSTRNGDAQPMIAQAFEVLERGARIPGSDILHEQLLIVGHQQLGQPADPAWWTSLLAKLRSRPPTTADIGALIELMHCYEQGICQGSTQALQQAFEAAVAHASTDSVLLSAHAEFADKYANDPALAEKQLRAGLAISPNDPRLRANLVAFLVHHRRFDDARLEIGQLRRASHFGALQGRIEELEHQLQDAENATPNAARP